MTANAFWLVALNVGLGLLVLLPLLLVVGACVLEVVKRARRRRDVRFESLPGIGRVPVLRFEPDRPVRRRTAAGGPALGA